MFLDTNAKPALGGRNVVTTNKASPAACQIVVEILAVMSEPGKDILIRSSLAPENAAAVWDGLNPVIVYDANFLEHAMALGANKWPAYAVLAHEMGHIAMGHIFWTGDDRRLEELQADFFAGGKLADLKATLHEAKSAVIAYVREEIATGSPSRAERLDSIEDGWMKAWFRQNSEIIKSRDKPMLIVYVVAVPLNSATAIPTDGSRMRSLLTKSLWQQLGERLTISVHVFNDEKTTSSEGEFTAENEINQQAVVQKPSATLSGMTNSNDLASEILIKEGMDYFLPVELVEGALGSWYVRWRIDSLVNNEGEDVENTTNGTKRDYPITKMFENNLAPKEAELATIIDRIVKDIKEISSVFVKKDIVFVSCIYPDDSDNKMQAQFQKSSVLVGL